MQGVIDLIRQYQTLVIGSISICVAVVLYLRQRQHKCLSYEILTYEPLLSREEETKGKIEIRFKNTIVESVHLLLLRIFNSGNIAVVPDDFKSPLQVHLGENVSVLAADVAESRPTNLQPDLLISGNTVRLSPMLFNPRDSVTIRVLASKSYDLDKTVRPVADGRIVGVRGVREYIRERHVLGRLVVITLAMGVLVLSEFYVFIYAEWSPVTILALSVIVGIVIMSLVAVFREMRYFLR